MKQREKNAYRETPMRTLVHALGYCVLMICGIGIVVNAILPDEKSAAQIVKAIALGAFIVWLMFFVLPGLVGRQRSRHGLTGAS